MKRIFFVLALILLSSTSFAAMRFHPIPYSRGSTPPTPAASITAFVWSDESDDSYWGMVIVVPTNYITIGDPELPYSYDVDTLVFKNNTSLEEYPAGDVSSPSPFTYVGSGPAGDIWYSTGIIQYAPIPRMPFQYFGSPDNTDGVSNVTATSLIIYNPMFDPVTFNNVRVLWYQYSTLMKLPIWH